jgi:hypothetical protein
MLGIAPLFYPPGYCVLTYSYKRRHLSSTPCLRTFEICIESTNLPQERPQRRKQAINLYSLHNSILDPVLLVTQIQLLPHALPSHINSLNPLQSSPKCHQCHLHRFARLTPKLHLIQSQKLIRTPPRSTLSPAPRPPQLYRSGTQLSTKSCL